MRSHAASSLKRFIERLNPLKTDITGTAVSLSIERILPGSKRNPADPTHLTVASVTTQIDAAALGGRTNVIERIS